MEYNYVIFGTDSDLYRQSYSDVYGLENVCYIAGHAGDKKGLMRFLCRAHFCTALYKFNMPGKRLWNSTFFKDDFQTKRPLCFLFFRGWLEWDEYGLFDYLKRLYPDARFVLVFSDLVATLSRGAKAIKLDLDRCRQLFDLTLSFDQNDCQQYGFIYHPLVFSSFHGELDKFIPDSDVYFLGKAKDRLPEIIGAYEQLRSYGLKCDFHLVGVSEADQVHKDDIRYIDGMDYQTNLQHILHTKCLLEVMQQNGVGFTQRVCEAVSLDKKIITNNSKIDEAPFYNDRYILKYKEPTEITRAFCEGLKQDEPVDYHYKENLSPLELLDFVTARL